MSDDLGEQYIVEVTEPCVADSGVSINDFYAYMPQHSYIFTPCREFWAAASINARVARIPVLNANGRPKRSKGKIVTLPATTWLDQKPAGGATHMVPWRADADSRSTGSRRRLD
jgi:hypothetical protein